MFWDPISADIVWKSKLHLVVVSLDATNHVPLTKEFLATLGDSSIAVFTKECWKFANEGYYLWDTLACFLCLYPDFAKYRQVKSIIVTQGPAQGRTKPDDNGRFVDVPLLDDGTEIYKGVASLLGGEI